jgi:hypothetical protein
MLSFLQVHEHEIQHQSNSSSAPSPSRAPFVRRCHQCGSVDHIASQCPIRATQLPRVASIFSRIECSHCHKLGHSADRCFILHPNLRPSYPPADVRFSSGRPQSQCSHCKMVGHTREQCFHLLGFPPRDANSRPRERSRSPAARTAAARTAGLPLPPAREPTPFHLQG